MRRVRVFQFLDRDLLPRGCVIIRIPHDQAADRVLGLGVELRRHCGRALADRDVVENDVCRGFAGLYRSTDCNPEHRTVPRATITW